jgi:uncharacterized membrane protein
VNPSYLIPLYWVFIFAFATYQVARIRGVWSRFSAAVVILRFVAALAMIGIMGTNINPGGDGVRYQDAAEALAFQPTGSLAETARLWGDYRYVPYIAISSFFEALGSTYFVSLFQACVHLLGAFFLYGALLRCASQKSLARLLFLSYALLPMLVYYSHVYLRDIYLSFASAWFIYGLTRERRSHILTNVLLSLSVIAVIRFQYLPIYGIGIAIFLMFGGRGGKALPISIALLLGALLIDFAYYFSPERFVPYLIASGAIDIDSSVPYDSINALDYFSIGAWLKTVAGIFGPFHMFYGPEYLLIEYRGDYAERLSEGTSAFLFVSVVLAVLIRAYRARFHHTTPPLPSHEVNRVQSAPERLLSSSANRRLVAVSMTIIVLMTVVLTLVGYNRWRMPLIPLYFVVCAALGTRSRDLRTAGIYVTIAFFASLLVGSL